MSFLIPATSQQQLINESLVVKLSGGVISPLILHPSIYYMDRGLMLFDDSVTIDYDETEHFTNTVRVLWISHGSILLNLTLHALICQEKKKIAITHLSPNAFVGVGIIKSCKSKFGKGYRDNGITLFNRLVKLVVCHNGCLWVHKNDLGHGNGRVRQLQDTFSDKKFFSSTH
ncbi:hypothetical protein GQX74_013152 [Glossina fuscipes]|nr:hypothetical protein GQX74_013152 [Glossina fuscipes]